MDRIFMQFPFDSSMRDEYLDGELHKIDVNKVSIVKLAGRIFYILDYTDYSKVEKKDDIALTMIVKNSLVNVELDDYSYLHLLKSSNNLPEVDVSTIKFPKVILLGQMVNAKKLFTANNATFNPLDVDEYVCLGDGEVQNATGCGFNLCDTIDASSESRVYQFRKSPSFPMKDEMILNGVSNASGIYDFSIIVPEGMMGDVLMKDENGNVKTIEVVLMPGEHNYHVSYGRYNEKKDFENAIKAGDLSVYMAPDESLTEEENARMAFLKASSKEAASYGFDANGEIIDDARSL